MNIHGFFVTKVLHKNDDDTPLKLKRTNLLADYREMITFNDFS